MSLRGRRGSISIDKTSAPRQATKQGRHDSLKGTIHKESLILQKLMHAHIDFTPRLIASWVGRFRYERIHWEHFDKVYTGAASAQKKHLANQLVDAAYALDKLWIIHGELDDPRTNVLVDTHQKVRIIDFDRGKVADFSGKNLRHVAQRLYRTGHLSLPIVRSLKHKEPKAIHDILVYHLFSSKKNMITWLLPVIGWLALVGIDQLTKQLFYDHQLLAQTRLFTPILNTGIGRSIAIPLPLVIVITLIISVAMLWRIKKHPRYRVALLILLAWAVGNLIDRILYSGVRDFIDFHVRPIFNFADIYLSIGIVRLVAKEFFVHTKN